MPPNAIHHLDALAAMIAPPLQEAAAAHVSALRAQLERTAQPVLWSRLTMAVRTELSDWLVGRGIRLRFEQPDDMPLVHCDPDAFVARLRDACLDHGTKGATTIAVSATIEGPTIEIAVSSDGAPPWTTRCLVSRLRYVE